MAEYTKTNVFLYALAALVGTLLVLNLIAYHLEEGTKSTLRSDKFTRNPNYLYYWKEYTDVELDQDDVVIISNSQGFGLEVGDKEIYASILKDRLEEEGFVVHNWSTHRAIGGDLFMLTHRALQQEPKAVIYITRIRNFIRNRYYQSPSDTWRLIDLDYLSSVPYWYVRDVIELDYTVHSLQKNAFPLSRAGEYLLRGVINNGLDSRTPRLFTPKISFKDYLSLDKIEYFQQQKTKKHKRKKIKKRSQPPPYPSTVKVLAGLFAQKKTDTKVVFVSMPIHMKSVKPASMKEFPKMMDLAEEHFAPLGVINWDMHDSVDDENFLSHNHFDENGHRQFAEVLLNRIKETRILE